MPDELKRCPFCGGEVDEPEKIPQEDNSEMWMIQCCNCWLTMLDPTRQRIISDWNTRQEECDRMRDALIGIVKFSKRLPAEWYPETLMDNAREALTNAGLEVE